MINNFDMSSTGTNLQLKCYYDNDMAQSFFDDSISRYNDNSFFFYNYDEKPETFLDIVDYENMTDGELLEYANDIDLDYDDGICRDDLEDALANETLCYNTLNQACLNKCSLYNLMEVRGYSQGDYARVIVSKNCKIKPSDLEHIFYDSPIYCEFVVNDTDYVLSDDFENYYNYDKDEIVKIAKEYIDNEYAIKWLEEHLPESPRWL